jgi:NADPH:quinone reductase-like Zn-dependent oxidoreductase
MRALHHDRYGTLDVVSLRDDLPLPSIGADEVLVRVRATAFHPGDLFCVRGAPLPVRMMTGWLRPHPGLLGLDLAGTVESVGARVTGLVLGDEVFGVGSGACAEFARAKATHLVPRSPALEFEHAAALPTSGLAALHALRDAARVRPGQKILINGASGGVGHFAVQIAKHLGAEVTAVCGSGSVEMVRALGADHVIDYTQQDYTRANPRYDVVLDNIENRSVEENRRILAPGGTLLFNSGTGASGWAFFVRFFRPLLLNVFVRDRLKRFISEPNATDLQMLAELATSGTLRPVLDSVHPLDRAIDALRRVESGHAHGKVVVRVE